MKKTIFIMSLICLIPTITFGGNYRIEELLSQKQSKIERLQKCQGKTKGLKIAGLSTLGLTAVGVGVNIAEANKIKTNTTTINATQQRIEETQAEIEKKKTEIKQQNLNTGNLSEQIRRDISSINAFASENLVGKEIKLSYTLQEVPQDVRGDLETAVNSFKDKCKQKYGVEKVNTESSDPNVFAVCECKYGKQEGEDACKDKPAETAEESTDAETPIESAPSNYAADCGDKAKVNDDCTTNAHAAVAKCMNLGKKVNNQPVLTCTAWSCETGYLLRLDKNGRSLGQCDSESAATARCERQGSNCKVLKQNTPRDSVTDGAYKCDCQAGNTAQAPNTSTKKVDVSKDGTAAKALSMNNICGVYDGEWKSEESSEQCSGLAKGGWNVTFDYGTINGTSKCAKNVGTWRKSGNPTGNGKYCWCKITGGVVPASSWVFQGEYDGKSGCAGTCTFNCARRVEFDSVFRSALGVGSGE